MSESATARTFPVVLEWDEDDQLWVSHVPTVGHLSTYGATREEVLVKTREAIEGYLEAARSCGVPVGTSDLPPETVELEVTHS